MLKHTHNLTGKNQNGVALIEALIAIFLFSLGVLALVGLQALMSKNVTQAKLRGEASFLATQLIGQMWANQGAAQVNLPKYAISSGACTDSSYVNCTRWLSSVGQALPSGTAAVTVTGTAVAITLNWQMQNDVPGRFDINANITN